MHFEGSDLYKKCFGSLLKWGLLLKERIRSPTPPPSWEQILFFLYRPLFQEGICFPETNRESHMWFPCKSGGKKQNKTKKKKNKKKKNKKKKKQKKQPSVFSLFKCVLFSLQSTVLEMFATMSSHLTNIIDKNNTN